MKRGYLLAVLLCACVETTPVVAGSEEDGSSVPPSRELAADPGPDPDPDPEPDPGTVPASEPDSPASALPLPHQLECVSSIAVADGREPSSWRGTLLLDPALAQLSLVSSPRFQSHSGVWDSEAEPTTHDVALHTTGPMTFVGGADDEVTVQLTSDAPFFSVALQLDGKSTDLVCWDRIGIFGSPWSMQPVALARFDVVQGRCVDSQGNAAALNELPLEFVLDTHYGECADLRGMALNAGDFAYPDVVANLRGADLSDAILQFSKLSGSFEGARLGTLDYGYAFVSGSIDDATELPAEGDCAVTEDEAGSDSVMCTR